MARSPSPSPSSSSSSMEIDNLTNLKKEEQQPHLSGAYIRSLVKQLTSSRPKDNTATDDNSGPKMAKSTEEKPHQQHKKQVRRRLHTTRPYQERLLNMAEARREIVAALKFHRASMKQAHEQKQQEHQQNQTQTSLPAGEFPCFEHESKAKSRRNPRIYPDNSQFLVTPTTAPSYHQLCWSNPQNFSENLNFPLPNQTLGLNLNFQDFNNIDTNLYSSSSSSFSSPSPCSVATEQEIGNPPPLGISVSGGGGGGLHQVMDDEEMAEIRSIGEQHQMEWNDTMNLVTSAWWFKFLKSMESGNNEVNKVEDDDYGYHNNPFDQVMEFPAWLNANDQHFDDYFSQDYYLNPSLPCMDIGEIEGMDGEWLA